MAGVSPVTFYSNNLLARRGRFSRIWLAAIRLKKVRLSANILRKELHVDISAVSEDIRNHVLLRVVTQQGIRPMLSPYVSSTLTRGVLVILGRQCHAAFANLGKFYRKFGSLKRKYGSKSRLIKRKTRKELNLPDELFDDPDLGRMSRSPDRQPELSTSDGPARHEPLPDSLPVPVPEDARFEITRENILQLFESEFIPSHGVTPPSRPVRVTPPVSPPVSPAHERLPVGAEDGQISVPEDIVPAPPVSPARAPPASPARASPVSPARAPPVSPARVPQVASPVHDEAPRPDQEGEPARSPERDRRRDRIRRPAGNGQRRRRRRRPRLENLGVGPFMKPVNNVCLGLYDMRSLPTEGIQSEEEAEEEEDEQEGLGPLRVDVPIDDVIEIVYDDYGVLVEEPSRPEEHGPIYGDEPIVDAVGIDQAPSQGPSGEGVPGAQAAAPESADDLVRHEQDREAETGADGTQIELQGAPLDPSASASVPPGRHVPPPVDDVSDDIQREDEDRSSFITILRKLLQMYEVLGEHAEFTFSRLCPIDDTSREAACRAFEVLLECVEIGILLLDQESPLGEIYITGVRVRQIRQILST